MGVEIHQTLAHLGIVDEGLVGFFVDEVVHGTTGGTPAQGEVQALGDFTHTLVAGIEHALVPLRVEQLGARIQADGLTQGADLGICRGGVGDVARGSLAVIPQPLDQLGGVTVEVVAHIGQGDLR